MLSTPIFEQLCREFVDSGDPEETCSEAAELDQDTPEPEPQPEPGLEAELEQPQEAGREMSRSAAGLS